MSFIEEGRSLEPEFVREEPRSFESEEPRTFRASLEAVGITLAIGIGLAVMAIRYLRAPAKEIEVVPEIIREPAPRPQGARRRTS